MTPYLQAGDIGIYRELKDLIYDGIHAWKSSDQGQYNNPKPFDAAIVHGSVSTFSAVRFKTQWLVH
jgi:hypothetical protein